VNGQTTYALEGSVFIGGAVVQWLRDEMSIIQESKDIEYFANKVEDSDGVYLVPAFAGLGAPHWNQHARGIMVGMTRGTNRAHLARAAQDSIAYQVMDLLNAMKADAGIEVRELRVDGGATVNNTLMQFQSDLLGEVPVVRPVTTETTALGAAYLAGLAVGFWDDIEEIRKLWKADKTFEREMESDKVRTLTKGWQRAVNAAITWADDR
jgi:glycerol kinase